MFFTLTLGQYNSGGGGSYNTYEEEAPAPKLKFNIGFNVPSMSISLPKLELPQISIRASIKQKKPFQLQLPQISFTKHISAEEDVDDTPAPAAYKGNAQSYDAPQQNTNYGSNNNGGYRAASSYERPATGGYGGNVQEDAVAYGAAQVNTQNNGYHPQPQQQNPGYATGFQGHAVSDYKSAASNYYAPPPTNAPQRHNNGGNSNVNNYRQVQDTVQAYNSEPVYSQQLPPVIRQITNDQSKNYGSRIVHANNNYQRRSQVNANSGPSGEYQASELRTQYILSEPLVDYSTWRPMRLSHYYV